MRSSQTLNSRTKLVSAAWSSWELWPHSFPDFPGRPSSRFPPAVLKLPGSNFLGLQALWASVPPFVFHSKSKHPWLSKPLPLLTSFPQAFGSLQFHQGSQANSSFLPASTKHTDLQSGPAWGLQLLLSWWGLAPGATTSFHRPDWGHTLVSAPSLTSLTGFVDASVSCAWLLCETVRSWAVRKWLWGLFLSPV